MEFEDRMREFILSFLDTQPNHVDLKTVQKLIDYGKNNKYTAPMLLTQLNQMDDAHEKVLTVTFDVDFIDGVKLLLKELTIQVIVSISPSIYYSVNKCIDSSYPIWNLKIFICKCISRVRLRVHI